MVFISYATENLAYATEVFKKLHSLKIKVWFAPVSIKFGADFANEIAECFSSGAENQLVEQFRDLDENELIDARLQTCPSCKALIFICSRFSKNSVWCEREVLIAIGKHIPVFVLKVDDSKDTGKWESILYTLQNRYSPKLTAEVFDELVSCLPQCVKESIASKEQTKETITFRDIRMDTIASGDPYFEEGDTLFCGMSKCEFFLSPPDDLVTEDLYEWRMRHFAEKSIVFDKDLEFFQNKLGISDLISRIDAARRLVFLQFVKKENGCYFNNKKYGINSINPYGRTEDYSERPLLEIELYTTDYYTHRVMKEVCKALYREHHSMFFERINYGMIDQYKILLTSLGINLLLLDADSRLQQKTILTTRSLNSAETYGTEKISLSVVEGVSLSDYDHYHRRVNLSDAVRRGLDEELGVTPQMIQEGSIRFYDLFINLSNLEMGVFCTATLKNDVSLEDVSKRKGKDAELEVRESHIIKIAELHDYVIRNKERVIPQAIYSIGSYLNRYGATPLLVSNAGNYLDERFIKGKWDDELRCEDIIVETPFFNAVIDGVTTKSGVLYDGKTGGRYAAELLAQAIREFDELETAVSAFEKLDKVIADAINDSDNSVQACAIVYSKNRREVWNYGDCELMINEKRFTHKKIVDDILSHLRALVISAYIINGGTEDELLDHDIGREAILPFLKLQSLFANSDGYFGYPVLNGKGIMQKHLKVYKVYKGDHVVIASDGYPKLFSSLSQSEKYLEAVLERDPLSYLENIQTKMLYKECCSYDDRAYLSFTVE